MILNIQFSTSKFQSVLLAYAKNEVLTSQRLNLDGIKNIPFDPADASATTEPGVIDRIEIEDILLDYLPPSVVPPDTKAINTPPITLFGGLDPLPQFTNISVRNPVALVNISVYAIRVSDLETVGLNQASDSEYTKFDVQAVFKISQPAISGGNLSLAFSPIAINFGLFGNYIPSGSLPSEAAQQLGEDLLQTMIDNAAAWFPPISFPINNLDSVFGAGLTVWNAGLRVSNGVVDLQLQVERDDLITFLGFPDSVPGAWVALWNSYFSATLRNRLVGIDWGVFFPTELFDRRVASTLESALAGRSNVVLNSRPTSTWSVSNMTEGGGCLPGEIGTLDTRFAVHLPGACVPWGYDMDVNLTLLTTVSVPRAGVLRLDLVASHEVDPGDVFVCGSLNAMLLAGGGLTIGGVFGGWIGAVVGGILGGLLGGFGTMGAILAQDIPPLSTPELTAVDGTNNAYFAEIEIEQIENRVLGTIGITTVIPCEDGLMAGGNLTELPALFQRLPSGRLPAPRWRQPYRAECPADGEEPTIFGELGFRFDLYARSRPIPLVVWRVEILEQTPAASWPAPQIYQSDYTLVYNYNFSRDELAALRADAGSDLPRIKLLVQTNAGARIFQVPVLADYLSDESFNTLRNEILEECNANQDLIDMFEDRTRNLRDFMRSPFPFVPEIDIDVLGWSLGFTGLDPQAHITLNTLTHGQTEHFAGIHLDQLGTARFEFWQQGNATAQPIQLHVAGAGGNLNNPSPGFVVMARGYRLLHELELHGSWRDHALLQNQEGLFAAVLTLTGLRVFKRNAAGNLLLVHRQNGDHLEQITARAGQLFLTGTNGQTWSSTNGSDWQLLQQQGCDPQDAGMMQQQQQAPPSQTAISVQMPEGALPVASTKGFAWVLNDNCDRLQLLELVATDGGGYYNPCG